MTEISATRRRRVAFANLGCRLNIAESDALAARFVGAGYEVSGFGGDAPNTNFDAVVVNTCTVTAEADRKSRNITRRAARAASGTAPAVVVATGCFATGAPAAVAAIPGVDYVIPNQRKAAIFDLVQAHLAGEVVLPDRLPADLFGYRSGVQPLHTRATLKIQDGCDNNCTFCIIPQVRGRAQSRDPDDVLEEAQRLVSLGHRELVVTGVNIGRYRARGLGFAGLLAELLQLTGDYRIRLSSLEPNPLGDDFLALVGNQRLCPHFHLCLQSGSDRTLLRMRREYTVDEYVGIAESIEAEVRRGRRLPPQFTTDVMVGFPGESEADFASTMAVCSRLQFGHIHAFRYSPRQGTRAARMPDPVADDVSRRRSADLRELADRLASRYRATLVGLTQQMLIERRTPRGNDGASYLTGYGECYAPITLAVGVAQTSGFDVVDIAPVEIDGLSNDLTLSAHPTSTVPVPPTAVGAL